MNKLNIKKLFSKLCCSQCGHDFDEESIYVLREEEGLFVLQVICPNCQKSFGIAILGMTPAEIKEEDEDKLPLEIKDFPEPITDDDVLDAHKFISSLEDDWMKYIPDEYKN